MKYFSPCSHHYPFAAEFVYQFYVRYSFYFCNCHVYTLCAISFYNLAYCNVVCVITHYSDVIIGAMASQITSFTIVYSTVYSGADQRKHQRSASVASVRGIHRWPVNSPHKGPVTRKMFQFDDVIMSNDNLHLYHAYLKCQVPASTAITQFNRNWFDQISTTQNIAYVLLENLLAVCEK